jgi:aspergillopepsin I
VKSYYSKVQGASLDSSQGGYTFPCSQTPPDFNVAIGGKTFTVPGANIKYAPISAGASTCFGGIQANTGIGFNIFGDVFLKAVYAIFDDSGSSPRLGFASQSS